MMLHIVPKLFASPGAATRATLLDLTVEPFGLYLSGDVDLDTRHPYPKPLPLPCLPTSQQDSEASTTFQERASNLIIQAPAFAETMVYTYKL